MRLANLRQHVNETLSGEAVPQLNIKGNTFTLIADGASKVVTQIDNDGRMYVDVHFVDANTTTSKSYYKEKFSNKEEEQVAPTCFSEDSIAPSNQSTEKQADQCSLCPHNVWGTAINDAGTGAGKRCRDMWKTAVIVPAFSNDALWQLRVPPASLKNWKAYMAKFAEFEVQGREGNVGDVITRVYFEPGKQGILNFEPTAMISDQQRAQLEHVAEKDLAAYLIGLSSAPPALPAPAKQKMLAAPTATQVDAIKKYAQQEADVAAQKSKLVAMEQQNAQHSEVEEVAPEEDEITALRRKLAAAEAKTQQPVQQQKVSSLAGVPKGMGSLGQSKTALAPKPKGAIELQAGMRTKTGVIGAAKSAPVIEAPKAKGVSKFAAAMAVEDAEIIEEESAPVEQKSLNNMMTKKAAVAPEGIPGTQLPPELQALLAGVMGK